MGKGVLVSSLAKLIQSRGFAVACVKCDMYVNIDAGTMRPTEHGEVFVGEDGIEADQDLGNYERFIGQGSTAIHYITTGQIYQEVIARERNLEYNGEDVEVVPHVPQEIIRRIKLVGKKSHAEIVLVEFGGTVGEYQTVLFLEADRMMKRESPEDIVNIHISYLPIPESIGEMKTKPVQYSVRTLNAAGIQPEFVVGRSQKPMDKKRKDKISNFCSVPISHVISNPDVKSIYELPLVLDDQQFGENVLKALNLPLRKKNIAEWKALVSKIQTVKEAIRVGIVGKYYASGEFSLEDSYISVREAIKHAAWAVDRDPEIVGIDSEEFERDKNILEKRLKAVDAVIVPGGFGGRGVEGKIAAIQYVREHNIPFLGLCYGMQLAVIEFARNVLGIADASSEEINPKTKNPVIHVMEEQVKKLREKKYGATMRLGAYPCVLKKNSIVRKAYGAARISERHRHRYEFNNIYRERCEKAGLAISGASPDNLLAEIVELKKHPFYVGVQFHPEFKSRPLRAHPLFVGLLKAAKEEKGKAVRS